MTAVVRVVDVCSVGVEAFQLTLPSSLAAEGIDIHTVVSVIENLGGSTQGVGVTLTRRS